VPRRWLITCPIGSGDLREQTAHEISCIPVPPSPPFRLLSQPASSSSGAVSDPAGSSPARSAGALLWPPIPSSFSPVLQNADCCLLRDVRLGPPGGFSAENMTRLLRSLIVATRWFAPLSQGLSTPLRTVGSLLPPGVQVPGNPTAGCRANSEPWSVGLNSHAAPARAAAYRPMICGPKRGLWCPQRRMWHLPQCH